MKNAFVEGPEVSTIVVRRRSGDVLLVPISSDLLPRAQEFPGTWCALTTKSGATYIVGKDYSVNPNGHCGGGRNVYLHRWLMRLEHGDRREVNHVDWTPTNNTSRNLEVGSRAQNRRHRLLSSRPNQNNRGLGVRNVRQLSSGKFSVVVAGKHLGTFSDMEDAKRAAAKGRADVATRLLTEAATRNAAPRRAA